MKIFKTKEFARYARREDIDDQRLCEAVARAERGLIDADLGGGLIKQRVGRAGQGRRGGYRTLMAFSSQTRTVFVYGFAKSERDNIGPDELHFWRSVARGFFTMSEEQLGKLIAAQEITEVTCHD
ncbi:type II toxin-antitoxin system RelE/ParE family toxin [Methylocystis parvus]|uniref:Type II toxin-antitoxin system RelE/ParE family toxin n=1 Tax=Methylocystis parvus TaxID=134 RepID=A0A6B8MDX9_9HYPH|nr:type II toxin-antitoxin system RelE/ParE family toxin [Methylocystis parvus]QGM99952.1 type II toxin-antitoxin system RelE/ParE family toxin [Methylocystis parvus]WBK02179.1 type II toxin-antitoxin system RelE/ParE family toxin [Methylocystis parvus OBBP]